MSPQQEDWITVLREQCKRTSQAEVAKRLGYSAAVVNQVLKGTYKGDVNRVQQAVEGALMGMTVDCPVIGELARNRCLEYQRREFASTNPTRVTLSRTCPTCPNRRTTGGDE
jgi:transcriptional regulator with XRE-family HTH domain